MQSALMPVGVLTVPNGEFNSNTIGLEAYADAESLFILTEEDNGSPKVFVDPELTISIFAGEFSGAIGLTGPGMFEFETPAGYGIFVSQSTDVGVKQYFVWKRCLIG